LFSTNLNIKIVHLTCNIKDMIFYNYYHFLTLKLFTRYEEESSTSQLGWHPEDTPILYRETHKILLKIEQSYIQEGRLDQNPQQKREAKN
jgi:hypothetical protein